MKDNLFLLFLIAYFCLVVFTWGHAWNNPAICVKEEIEREKKYCRANATVYGSIFPPFYWSVELQRGNKS